MNYLAEIKAFEQWLETNHLPILSQTLWYKLMNLANKSGWSEWIIVDNLSLMAIMQTRREATLIKLRDELIKAGLIEYRRGKKGSPNKYRVKSFTCKNVVQRVVKGEVQRADETADLYKQKQNKTISMPVTEIYALWNRVCSQKQVSMAPHAGRERNLLALMQTYGEKELRVVFQKVKENEFLSHAGWCDFDWVIKAENFEKILSGRYDAPVQQPEDWKSGGTKLW